MSQEILLYTDGASRGNPGLAGAGIAISVGQTKHQLAIFLGRKTNNEAEYLGLLAALRYLLRLKQENEPKQPFSVSQAIIKMDSKLVVQQISGQWKIKEPRLQKIADQCQQIITQLPYPIELRHVRREKNETADWLANQAIDLAQKN